MKIWPLKHGNPLKEETVLTSGPLAFKYCMCCIDWAEKKNSPCASWKAAGMREELSENDHENKNKQPGLNVSGCGSSEAFTTQKQQQTLTN